MSPIPLSVLGGVFVVWLIGTLVVLAILRAEGERSTTDDEPDHRRRSYSR